MLVLEGFDTALDATDLLATPALPEVPEPEVMVPPPPAAPGLPVVGTDVGPGAAVGVVEEAFADPWCRT